MNPLQDYEFRIPGSPYSHHSLSSMPATSGGRTSDPLLCSPYPRDLRRRLRPHPRRGSSPPATTTGPLLTAHQLRLRPGRQIYMTRYVGPNRWIPSPVSGHRTGDGSVGTKGEWFREPDTVALVAPARG